MKATLEHEDLLHTTAELVLDEARKKGAEPVETWVRRNTMTEIYYEAQKISMVRTVFSDEVSLKVLKNQKKAAWKSTVFKKPLFRMRLLKPLTPLIQQRQTTRKAWLKHRKQQVLRTVRKNQT